ncbi:unnamed protein product [marine sediment metagenome]|uniref:Uncharacterized protein n=1 Tax=marine sediment metagenome TaxID=412755 RepID=X0TSP3_9ZZZZ
MIPLNTIERAMKQVCTDYMKGEKKLVRIKEYKGTLKDVDKHYNYKIINKINEVVKQCNSTKLRLDAIAKILHEVVIAVDELSRRTRREKDNE